MRAAGAVVAFVGLFGIAAQAVASPPPWSNSRHNRYVERDSYDYARVVDVEPIVRQVRVETPRRECWDEVYEIPGRAHISDPGVGAPTLLGGIIGGVVGHQFGRGRGRDAATVAGTLIGAHVGYDSAVRRNPPPGEERVVERCDIRYEDSYQERIDGYRVTYEYNGREYTTRLPYEPGERIRVRVAVAPAE